MKEEVGKKLTYSELENGMIVRMLVDGSVPSLGALRPCNKVRDGVFKIKNKQPWGCSLMGYPKDGDVLTGYSLAGDVVGPGGHVAVLLSPSAAAKWEQTYDKWIEDNWIVRERKMANYYTGTDPEFFALDENGVVIPAFTFLPSVQQRIEGEPFWDGFQAEINPKPFTCLQNLHSSIRSNLEKLRVALHKVAPKGRLAAQGVVEVSKEMLSELPDEQVQLGCLPSFNVYPDVEPIEVTDARSLLYRTAGCHIHFGTATAGGMNYTRENLREGVKALDAIASVLTTSLFRKVEDPRRRLLYGRAGEYRLPKHGLEYRTPPAEVMSHPALFHLCFDVARQAFGVGAKGHLPEWDAKEEEVREVIDTCNWKGAEKLLKRNEAMLRALMTPIYPSGRENGERSMKNFMTLVFTGAHNWLDIKALEANWEIDRTFSGVGCEMSRLIIEKPIKGKKVVAVGAAAGN